MIYFQLPFQSTIYTISPSPGNDQLISHSFDEKTNLTFKGALTSVSPEEIEEGNDLLMVDKSNYENPTEEEYVKTLEGLIQDIKEKNLAKVVYSRRKIVPINKELSLGKTFIKLCEAYPNAFKYFFIKNGTAWAGAFSEVLGEYHTETKTFKTMSLAGTLPKEEAWTDKEIEEQKPVSLYIQNILNKYASEVKVSETYDHISGNIKHLRTDFEIVVEEDKVPQLIAELHPTPAVCGFPKDVCTDLISKYEAYPREFYAGYNEVRVNSHIYYFVNLRCARLFKDRIHAFVGGGITAKSHPEKEWQETELKAQAILNNLIFI